MREKGITIAHYTTGAYKINDTYLNDDEYGRALDTFVKACVDAVIVRKSENGMDWEMLLGKRNIEPYSNWWTFGGRMRAGETPLQTLQRNLERDLDMFPQDIQRIEFLTLGSFAWGTREQKPKHHGTCDIILFHLITLCSSEKSFQATPLEYSDIRWIPFMEIAEESNGYHSALISLVRCIRQKMMSVR